MQPTRATLGGRVSGWKCHERGVSDTFRGCDDVYCACLACLKCLSCLPFLVVMPSIMFPRGDDDAVNTGIA